MGKGVILVYYYATVLFKLILAGLLGALIGYEREFSNRPAGLRTNTLTCLGAALIQILSLDIFAKYSGLTGLDPARLGAQVISGIGFLGAGTIINEGVTVRGLTTAAGLWVVACIGLAIGNGSYFAGILTALFAFITLKALKSLEGRVSLKSPYLNMEIKLEDKPGQIGKIGQILGHMNANIKNMHFLEQNKEVLNLYLAVQCPQHTEKHRIVEAINNLEGVYSVEEVG
jgi:putative Mg2+ transporter-C (MgtC) family protein